VRTETRTSNGDVVLAAALAAATIAFSVASVHGQDAASKVIYAYRSVGTITGTMYEGSLGVPSAVATDPEHAEIWVADTAKNLLTVFAADEAVSLFTFGSAELIRQPERLAVSPDGELLVVEGKRHGIRRFSYRGEYRGELALENFDHEASIGAVAFDGGGNLYVGENHSGQIFVYGAAGKLRFQFGSRGAGEGQFQSISGIAIAADGTIFVVDQQGIPVQTFDAHGNYLTSWGRHQMGKENFALPSGVAVNSKGYVVVSDELRHDVKTFDRDGNVIQMFGGQGTELGALSFPTGVAVDTHDRLYVAERGNRRVQIFELIEVPAPAVKAAE
jgi:DNA-binding beta-propeller fold protein YncE